jgi:hypothetical protein
LNSIIALFTMNIYENESEPEALKRVTALLAKERKWTPPVNAVIVQETIDQLRALVRGKDEIPEGTHFLGRNNGLACFYGVKKVLGGWLVYHHDVSGRRSYDWSFQFSVQPTDLHVDVEGRVVFKISDRYWNVDHQGTITMTTHSSNVSHWIDRNRQLSLPEHFIAVSPWTGSRGKALWDEYYLRIKTEMKATAAAEHEKRLELLTTQHEILSLRALIHSTEHELAPLPSIPRPIAKLTTACRYSYLTNDVLGVNIDERYQCLILSRGSVCVMVPQLVDGDVRWTVNDQTISFETKEGWMGYDATTLKTVEPIPYQLNHSFELVPVSGRVYISPSYVWVVNGSTYAPY